MLRSNASWVMGTWDPSTHGEYERQTRLKTLPSHNFKHGKLETTIFLSSTPLLFNRQYFVKTSWNVIVTWLHAYHESAFFNTLKPYNAMSWRESAAISLYALALPWICNMQHSCTSLRLALHLLYNFSRDSAKLGKANLKECVTHTPAPSANKAAHSGFETQ